MADRTQQERLPRGDRQLARRLVVSAADTHRFFPRRPGSGQLEPLAMQVLLCLYLEPAQTVAEVADRLELTNPASVSRALGQAEVKGLTEDAQPEASGRARPLRLSEAGAAAVKAFLDATRSR